MATIVGRIYWNLNVIHMNPESESKKIRYKQSLFITSNMDHQLLCQKSHQKFSVMKQKNCCFQKNSLFWHFYSHFVLKTTETPVFMFSLLRFFTNFWRNNWQFIFDVVERLCYWSRLNFGVISFQLIATCKETHKNKHIQRQIFFSLYYVPLSFLVLW